MLANTELPPCRLLACRRLSAVRSDVCFFCFSLSCSERLKREEQGRLEQEKWKRRMETESAEAQEQLSDIGMLSSELRGSLAQKEKEITSLQGSWDTHWFTRAWDTTNYP